MSRFRPTTVTVSSRRRVLAGALATALLAPAPASAFFQQTKLEGTVGTDIGGVWLSIQQVMPQFRINFPKPARGSAVPIVVGPIPADLEPVTGRNPAGVVITGCPDPGFCSGNGLLVGDILVKVNATEIADAADFEKAIAAVPQSVLLSVRRPALKMSTARLLKIRYAAEGKETEGASVAQEEVDVKVLDVEMPFAAALERARQSHSFFQPPPPDLEGLAKGWFELPTSHPPVLVSGNHRFVARASFDDALAGDKNLTNAKYAVIMDMGGNPLQGGGGKVIDVYGIESLDDKTMEGSYVTVTIANAPFPINIEFQGRFRMTKLAAWSDRDDKLRAEREAKRKPPEDLDKYKTLPDVPPPAKSSGKGD